MDSSSSLENVAGESDGLERQTLQVDAVLQLPDAHDSTQEENNVQPADSSVLEDTSRKEERQKSPCGITQADQVMDSPSFFPADRNEFTHDFENNSLGATEANNNDGTDQNIYSSLESSTHHKDPCNKDSSRTSLGRVALELFKFSRQYKQLQHDMNSIEKAFEEALTCEMSRETSMEFCKRFQDERKRSEELVEKMLLNCDIEELHEIYSSREQRMDSSDDRMVLGSRDKGTTDSRKFQCEGRNEEFKAEVKSTQKEACVQTESPHEDYLTKDNVRIDAHRSQNAGRLPRDFEDLQEKQKKMAQEHNELQAKIFEVESELCSVEIERDLRNETARYLEEQVTSVNSVLTLRENELVSLRKRYKFLNEALQSSEELRERLESETSRMIETIKELEERLEKVPHGEDDIFNKNPLDNEGHSCDSTKDVERLEGEIFEVNAVLEKEKATKKGVEEMLASVEKARQLLLKELDDLKDAYQLQKIELEEWKEKKHNASNQELQENGQRKQQQGCEENNEEILELQKFSRRILILEDENKKLEEEVYQQLEIIEKIETENTAFRQEQEDTHSELRKVELESVKDLVTGYYSLKRENGGQDKKIKQLESVDHNWREDSQDVKPEMIDLDPEMTSTSKVESTDCICKSYSVPRSEYVKLKFQLKSMSDEMRLFKEVTVPEAMKNLSAAVTEERTSLKNENNVVKKWLKTMKESISIVTEKDEVISKRFDSVVLETQLHEATLHASELQHELEVIKKDKGILLFQNEGQEEALNVLKQHLINDQSAHENTLKESKEKFERLEKELKNEKENHVKGKAKVVSLEERNAEVGLEFENVKRKLECSEMEKNTVDEELSRIKLDVLKYFGGEHLETVSKCLSDTKKKCSEYVKVIENNKNIIFQFQRELNALNNVNTALREELNEAKIEKEQGLNSEENVVNQIQALMQALETGKRNEQELLEIYMKEKMKFEESQEQINTLSSELQQTKVLLSEKEKECETSKVVIEELEATCQVYEREFEKITNLRGKPAEGSQLSSYLISNETTQLEETVVPQVEDESTAENFRELQEMLQGSLASKLQVLQRHFGELTEALCACRKLNVSLQERLHSVEMKHLESEGKNANRKRDEEFEKVMKELSEKEKSMEEMLCKKCPECNSDWGAIVNNANCEYLKDTLFHYKEVITRLRTDKETCEENLSEAHERIKKQGEKIAMLDYCVQEKNTKGKDSDKEDIRDIQEHSFPDEPRGETENETERHNFHYHEFVILVDEKSRNLKEELDCVTSKYINLRAAFEGCQRRLKFLESGEHGEVVVMGTETVAYSSMPSTLQRTSLETRSVGDDELLEIAQGRIFSSLVKNAQSEIQRNEPRFPRTGRGSSQKHACTQTVQDLDENQQINLSLFSEISFNFSESGEDAGFCTENDRMVIELTLSETEMDTLETQKDCNEIMDGGKSENDYSKLRNNIQDLESKTLFSRNELQRVKVRSFEEMLNFEKTLRNREEVNTLLTTKLKKLEQKNGELTFQVKELETKLLACDQETQRIQTCSLRERQDFEDTIDKLQDTNDTIKKRVEELEEEEKNLNIRIEEVEGSALECCNETERVKVCSFNERQTLQGTIQTFRNSLSIMEKDVDEHNKKNGRNVFKMRELEDKVSACNEEIQRIKVCSFNERKNLENKIKSLECTKTGIVTDHEKDKEELESRMKEFEVKILSRDKEIQQIKVCSFSERQNLEHTIKHFRDTIATNEKCVEDRKREDARMESRMKELESKMSSRDEEIKRIKVCAFNERENLEDTIKNLQNTVAITEKRVKENQREKTRIESRMKELEDKVQSCNEEKQRLKVCSFKEREECNFLKEKVRLGDEEISALRINVVNLENDKRNLDTTIRKKTEERDINDTEKLNLHENIERNHNEIEVWKQKSSMHKDEATNLEKKLEQLGNEKGNVESLMTEVNEEKRKEVKNFQETIKKCHEENNLWKQKVQFHEEEITVLKMKLEQLQKERENLKLSMEEMDEQKGKEVKNFQETIKKCHEENNLWKQKVQSHEEEETILKMKLQQLENESENIRRLMAEADEQKGKEVKQFQGTLIKCQEEIHLWKQKVYSHEEEATNFKKKLQQVENEKENLNRLMTEMDEKKGNEVKNVHEEILSWKYQVRLHEEEVIILNKKLEQLENEKENIKSLTKEMDEEKQKEVKNLQETIKNCHDEINLWKQKVQSHEEEATDLKKKFQQVENDKENLERSMTQMDQQNGKEVNHFLGTIEKYNEEIHLWKQKEQSHKEEAADLKTKLKQLENGKENVKNMLTEMDEKKKKEVGNLQEMIEKCHEEIYLWKQKVHSHKEEVIILKKKLEQIENEKEYLKRSMTEMDEQGQKEVTNLQGTIEKCHEEIDAWKLKLRACQDDVTVLRTKLEEVENEKQRNEEKEKEKQILEVNIKSSRKTLSALNIDIKEASMKKTGLEKELRELNLAVEKDKFSWMEKKEEHQQAISNLKEIMDELMKSKLTLLEEISQLSDQKKEGQEIMNNEFTQLRKLYKELQNENKKDKQERSKLEFQISSFKISLDTLQSAYEQSQDDNKQNEKRLQELRGQALKNQDKQKLINENGSIKKQVIALENKLKNSEAENKEILSSLERTKSRLLELEKEQEKYKSENVLLMERLKHSEVSNEEGSHSGNSSTQVNNLRKKLKEFRTKLGEEKKQREVREFEIKNLKEKVERLTKKEKGFEEQLDTNRKKFLELKTERDALQLDMEAVNKRKKREVEGYTSRIESLEKELKSFRGKEGNKDEGKQLKERFGIVSEQNKLLEMKLAANAERSSKENQDLENSLKLLQGRYDAEQERFKNTESSNQCEILELKKSLSAIERECENKARELEKLKDNLAMIKNEKDRIEMVLNEKTSEAKKWKKEAFDSKAEITFLRGALNILEKEGLTKKIP